MAEWQTLTQGKGSVSVTRGSCLEARVVARATSTLRLSFLLFPRLLSLLLLPPVSLGILESVAEIKGGRDFSPFVPPKNPECVCMNTLELG
jgi:hypothetical protein